MDACVFRLRRGADLYESIFDCAKRRDLSACALLCCVGCVSHAHIRLAGGDAYLDVDGPLEIVSVSGTVGKERLHAHIAFANCEGRVFGGHLQPGCIVDTTAEIVLFPLAGYAFHKEFDPETRYDELKITEARDDG